MQWAMIVSLINGVGNTGSSQKKNEIGHIKIKSKWIKALNVR